QTFQNQFPKLYPADQAPGSRTQALHQGLINNSMDNNDQHVGFMHTALCGAWRAPGHGKAVIAKSSLVW
ncbi:hypothetical protein BaRGS_00037372, partial [Batillaria attramentaria]